MVRVVLADDEEFVRHFLKSVMQSLSFQVVAEVDKGDEVISVMEETQPDILFLDINMPNLTGIEFLKKYASRFPNTCIIMLTSASLMTLIGEPSLSDVECFLRKDTPVEEMIESIKQTWINFKK
jgi:DNA-binding NarL/FixJ family response regulator